MKLNFQGIKGLFKGFSERKEGKASAESYSAAFLSDEAYSLITELHTLLGPRPSASKESKNAARHIADIFSKYKGKVTISSCKVYKDIGRYLVFFSLVISLLSSCLLLFNLSLAAIVLLFAFIYPASREFRKKNNILRRVFPIGEAVNVHSMIESQGEVEDTIIFSAHLDSAEIKKGRGGWHAKIRKLIPALSIAISSLLALLELLLSLVSWDFSVSLPAIFIVVLAIVDFLLSGYGLYLALKDKREFSPGSGDNLSGVAVVAELLRHFSLEMEQGRALRSTRLIFAIFDAEEIALQGSKAWYEKHSAYLVNARNINFDGLYKAEDLVFITTDGNGLVKLSSSLSSTMSSILSSMGYKTDVGKMGMFSGETDAASAALSGIEATTLTSMRPSAESPAHSREDTPDKVEKKALLYAISSAIKLVDLVDGSKRGDEGERSFLELDRKYKLTDQS